MSRPRKNELEHFYSENQGSAHTGCKDNEGKRQEGGICIQTCWGTQASGQKGLRYTVGMGQDQGSGKSVLGCSISKSVLGVS